MVAPRGEPHLCQRSRWQVWRPAVKAVAQPNQCLAANDLTTIAADADRVALPLGWRLMPFRTGRGRVVGYHTGLPT